MVRGVLGGVLGGSAAAQDARQSPQSGNAPPFRGFRTNPPSRIEAMGLFHAPLGRLRGIVWGSRGAGRPPGPSERQCAPFPGFQDTPPSRFEAMGRSYAPLGLLWGIVWRVPGAAAVRMDCRVVPAGEFRGCGGGGVCLVKPVALGRPGGGRDGGRSRRSLRGLGTRFSHGPHGLPQSPQLRFRQLRPDAIGEDRQVGGAGGCRPRGPTAGSLRRAAAPG